MTANTNPEVLRLAHQMKDIGVHMIDQIECSCGWKSESYFDGMEWAIEEWKNHLRQSEKDNSDVV